MSGCRYALLTNNGRLPGCVAIFNCVMVSVGIAMGEVVV